MLRLHFLDRALPIETFNKLFTVRMCKSCAHQQIQVKHTNVYQPSDTKPRWDPINTSLLRLSSQLAEQPHCQTKLGRLFFRTIHTFKSTLKPKRSFDITFVKIPSSTFFTSFYFLKPITTLMMWIRINSLILTFKHHLYFIRTLKAVEYSQCNQP